MNVLSKYFLKSKKNPHKSLKSESDIMASYVYVQSAVTLA